MTLHCGIIGLPNVGKSTLFNCLSQKKVPVRNFPYSTITPNVGIITVPDNRLHCLAKAVKSQKIIPTTVEIVDIAGLIKGACNGEGLGNQFLDNIRHADAIIHVLRCFDNENIIHIDNSVNPIRDKEIVDYELQLKDLETIESNLLRIKKKTQVIEEKQRKIQTEVLIKIKKTLEQGKPARIIRFKSISEKKIVQELFLLTTKPILYVCNVDESSVVSGNGYTKKVRQIIQEEEEEGTNLLIVSAQIESEIAELENYEERLLFLNELGLNESGADRLIKFSYQLLSLETFFTVGHREVRAWTYLRGSKAPQCAGIIHSDFEKGFIKAEVIKYTDFITFGSENACKEAGKMRIEGKEYIVQDGDIIHFRFSV